MQHDKERKSLPEDTSRVASVSFEGNLSKSKIRLKDVNNAWDSSEFQQHKKMSTIASAFCNRIKNETEEFLQQMNEYVQYFNDSKDIRQLRSYEDDQTLSKMKLLLMIHTTCSNITNLLMHCP